MREAVDEEPWPAMIVPYAIKATHVATSKKSKMLGRNRYGEREM